MAFLLVTSSFDDEARRYLISNAVSVFTFSVPGTQELRPPDVQHTSWPLIR